MSLPLRIEYPDAWYHAMLSISRGAFGETLATIGKAFGMSNYSSVSSVVSRMKDEIRQDASLRRLVGRIKREL